MHDVQFIRQFNSCFCMQQSPTGFGITLCSLWSPNLISMHSVVQLALPRPRRSVAGLSSCHFDGQGSIPGQSMWCLWWTTRHWYKFFSCQYHSTNTPNPSLSRPTCFFYYLDKRAKPGKLPKSNTLSEIGEYWIGNCFHFLVCTVG
jgi:hypothetical protein